MAFTIDDVNNSFVVEFKTKDLQVNLVDEN